MTTFGLPTSIGRWGFQDQGPSASLARNVRVYELNPTLPRPLLLSMHRFAASRRKQGELHVYCNENNNLL